MKNTVTILRERLFSIIRRLVEEPERYARKPDRDFTRKRTLTPAVLIQLIVTMDEKSIWKGLLGHFRRRIDTPSVLGSSASAKEIPGLQAAGCGWFVSEIRSIPCG